MLHEICIVNIKINVIFWLVVTLSNFVQGLRTSHWVVALILCNHSQFLWLRNVFFCLFIFLILILYFHLNVSKTHFVCNLRIIIKIYLSLNIFWMLDTILTSLTGNAVGSNYVRGCLVGGWLQIICISNDINYILLHLMIHFLFILIKIDFSLVFNFNILKKMLENIFGIFQVLFIALSSFVSILGSKLLVIFEKAFILQLLSIWKLIALWVEIMRV
jgi:hypothetical protein